MTGSFPFPLKSFFFSIDDYSCFFPDLDFDFILQRHTQEDSNFKRLLKFLPLSVSLCISLGSSNRIQQNRARNLNPLAAQIPYYFLSSLSFANQVAIVPEVTSKTKCREIMKFLIESYWASHLGNLLLAYDGKKSAFAAGAFPFESKEFVVKIAENNGREREFTVTIKFVTKKDLHHLKQFLSGRQRDCQQETIEALDVVLR
ncbi:hypothetical protein L6452_30745 [Arctium lappa]|uniref:Uncharacterized protein n=1 Tax=Arctium lappa TaxID=4217 RepID=A0ACB8ZK08_ARCLA|nr:hypothetical protein L6452_30745 [Arctium lappa]